MHAPAYECNCQNDQCDNYEKDFPVHKHAATDHRVPDVEISVSVTSRPFTEVAEQPVEIFGRPERSVFDR
jgi:hypothetical protein